MVVGAARHDAQPVAGERVGERVALRTMLAAYSRKAGCAASWKATAFAAITCMSGPPWKPGNTALSSPCRVRLARGCRPPRGPRSVLCVVDVTTSANGHRGRVRPAGDEAGDVRDVDHQQRADVVGDRTEGVEVDARAGRP